MAGPSPGAQVRPYELESRIGAGGMGEVNATNIPSAICGWTPDGRSIAYRADDGVHAVSPDGQDDRRVVAAQPFRVTTSFTYALNRSGELLVLDSAARPKATLTRYDVGSGEKLGGRRRPETRPVIVPDGPLWNLPFHSLVDPAGRHAIERFAIWYAPSLTVLHRESQQRPLSRNLLAVGSPRGDLPNAAAEARELGRLYGAGSTVLTGTEATAARWRALAPRSGILHLATHGVLNNSNPLFSYLELASGGVIDARSLLDLKLKASLAVLSGCETGRGELRDGEGVVGLAWAMMVAGVPSVVVSGWKVDSESTTQLMLAFHREMKSGTAGSKATALRSAAVGLMKRSEYRHPYYWAGFHLLGDGR